MLKSSLNSQGKPKLSSYEGVTPGAVDYSAVVQKIKHSGAEAVIFGGYHPEASKIITQMRKKRMETIFISDDGVKDDTFIKVAGKNAEGVYATGPADVTSNPLTKEYRDKYQQAYGGEPGAFFDNAVAAALALTNALAKAGSTDQAASGRRPETVMMLPPLLAISTLTTGVTPLGSASPCTR